MGLLLTLKIPLGMADITNEPTANAIISSFIEYEHEGVAAIGITLPKLEWVLQGIIAIALAAFSPVQRQATHLVII